MGKRLKAVYHFFVTLSDAWGITQALLSWKGGTSVVAVALIVSVSAYLDKYSRTQIIVLGLITFAVALTIFNLLALLAPVVSDKLRPRLNLEIQPTSGASDSLSLNITNLGRSTALLSAFCEITGHSNGVNDYPRGEYRCGWENGITETRQIRTGETASLLIATVQDVRRFELSEMILWRVVAGEKVKWASCRWYQHPDERLPEFDLKIRLVGDKSRGLEPLRYRLKPYCSHGPLEMLPTLTQEIAS